MTRFKVLLPWIAAALGIVVTAAVFYPGYLSWDSAYQWWQVRHHEIDPAHPPIMVWIWGLTNLLIEGPGGYFLFQLCLYWFSLALFVSSLRLAPAWQVVLVLLVGFWPPIWGLSLHLWKDVGTMSFFGLAAACYAKDCVRPHRAWRVAAVCAIVLACMYRHNALSAALPLLVYALARYYRLHPLKAPLGKFRALLFGGLACVFIQLLVLMPNQLLKLHSEPLWPLQALWDIAAVSVLEDRMLIPPEWMDPSLTMEAVKRDFNPVYSGLLFQSGLIKLNPYMNMNEGDFSALRKAWLRLPFDYPAAYWRHRFRVMTTLLGWHHDANNPSLVFHTRVTSFRDNPELVPRTSDIRLHLETAANQFSRGILFQGGWYLLLSLVLLGVAIRRHNPLMGALVVSGLFYVLPLLVAAPSSDFRYLGWMLQASLLAALAVFIPSFSNDTRYGKSTR